MPLPRSHLLLLLENEVLSRQVLPILVLAERGVVQALVPITLMLGFSAQRISSYLISPDLLNQYSLHCHNSCTSGNQCLVLLCGLCKVFFDIRGGKSARASPGGSLISIYDNDGFAGTIGYVLDRTPLDKFSGHDS